MAEDILMNIIRAYYMNNARDRLEVHFTDDSSGGIQVAQTVPSDKEDSLWALTKSKFTEDELIGMTSEFINELEERRQRQQDLKKSMEVEQVNDALFKAKLEVFELPEIKASKNRTLKSKIRKSETINQVYVYAGALVAIEEITPKESK